MDSTEPSLLNFFKSEKVLGSSSKPLNSSPAVEIPVADPLTSKTPQKPISAPRQSKKGNAAFSLKQVREAAQKLHNSDPVPSANDDPFADQILRHPGQHAVSFPESSVTKPREPNSSAKLPEKYEMLVKFFNCLDSSIRLLKRKGSLTTFTNIRPNIESLSDRRFTRSHLAQLKFILPEAIVLKEDRLWDELTLCMKPDICVTLDASTIVSEVKTKSGSTIIDMRKVFRKRLLDFIQDHPREHPDIPEEELPEPFNKPKHGTLRKAPNEVLSAQKHNVGSNPNPFDPPASSSHLPHSFKRSFSKCDQTNTESFANSHHNELRLKPNCTRFPPHPNTPIKDLHQSITEERTPAKPVSTTGVMTSTPTPQPPPRRGYMSPQGDSSKPPNKLSKRPLNFDSPVKNEVGEAGTCSSAYRDMLGVLSENILESIREKERKALEERNPAISQAKWRKQMVAGLPKMFDTIYFLFQSIQRPVIRKQELMNKILANYIDIIDSREAEEQLRLLYVLAPEWIYEKMSLRGDLLVCVNKIQSPDSIRMRLADAI
ncbi:unnamed protein product [Cuscuta epithymum]|uniref:CDT1 Geminin-binding domain-containing protein n=1 Tax=Cuscuta epithymum TaxID=186058 RepID=A0AAV0BYM0_9ASTE|nr:unnamed protein product [Cuscuta epithymum]